MEGIDLLTRRDRHLVKRCRLTKGSVDGQVELQAMAGVKEIVPRSGPRHKRADDRAGAETLRLRPGQLLGSEFALSGPVGQVQTHGDGYGPSCFIQFYHALNLMVHFAGMFTDWKGSRFVQAPVWLYEKNRINNRLIS